MIQKDKESSFDRIKGILIFRDDIEEIIDLLNQYNLTIEIQDENYLYENIDDLIKHKGSHPKKLKVEARNRDLRESINLDFEKKVVSIFSYGSKNMYALSFELKDYFKSKRTWYFRIFNTWFFLGAVISLSFFLNSISKEKLIEETLKLWVFGTLVLLLLISLLMDFTTHGINLIRKHEYGFWKRNQDKILLSIITAIFAILGTLLVQWLTKK